MCWGVPGKIIEIKGKTGIIQIENISKEISLDLLTDVQVGDFVVVHAGYAIEKVKPEDAEFTIKFFKGEYDN